MSTLASVTILDLFTNRPAFGIPGRLFFASDTGAGYYDTGSALGIIVPTGGAGLSLEVNGTPNASQTLLNLISGTGATVTDGGAGAVTIAASGGGGASGWVLLETETASNSAALDFVTRNASGQSGASFQSDFDEYILEVVGLVNGSSAVLGIQFSTNGGSSYDTSSNYAWQLTYSDTTGVAG